MDNKTYTTKTKRLEALLMQLTEKGKLSKKLQIELDLISEEIATYEETHYPFKPDNWREMIELRMYQRKLKQKDIAKLLNTTPSRISEMLNGKRALTFELAKQLYQKLHIDADLILK